MNNKFYFIVQTVLIMALIGFIFYLGKTKSAAEKELAESRQALKDARQALSNATLQADSLQKSIQQFKIYLYSQREQTALLFTHKRANDAKSKYKIDSLQTVLDTQFSDLISKP